jgi:hypothetical protein
MYPFCYDCIDLEDLVVVKEGDPLWSVHYFECPRVCLVLVGAGEVLLGVCTVPCPLLKIRQAAFL